MKKYSLIMILSIPLLLLVSAFLLYTARTEETRPLVDSLSFILSSRDGIDETIYCWEDEDGELVVFLPSYTNMSDLTMEPAGNKSIKLDGTEIEREMDCSRLELNTQYSITDGEDETTIRFLRSANVATMFVETETGTMDNVHRNKAHKENAEIVLFTEEGALDYRGSGFDQIRGHGNSTWKLDKRPYNLYLSSETDLLHMGRGSKWVLLSNGYDSTNLRNKMILDLADKVGSFDGFSVHTAYVDLYLNGEYAGVYLLAEHVSSFDNTEVLPEHGVLFYTDWAGSDEYAFPLSNGYVVKTVLPKPIPESRRQDLENAVMQLQDDLLSDGPDDSLWMDKTDIDSWARKYLIEEIFMNNDVGVTSQYYVWNDLQNKIYAGPCWDYDDTFGDYLRRSPRTFLANREWATDTTYTPWFHALMKKPVFQEKVQTLYRDDFLPELEWLLESGIQQYADRVHQATVLNRTRWDFGGEEEEIERMADFLEERVEFLNSAWIEGTVYHTITLKGLKQYHFYCVPDGEDCSGLPSPLEYPLPEGYNVNVLDTWYYEGTDEPFDPSVVLTEDITLYAKTEKNNKSASTLKRMPGKQQYITVLTLLMMITFLALMVRAEFGQNPSGKGGKEHGPR